MDFSNLSTKGGLIQDCEFWLFGSNYGYISDDTTRILEFTNLLNRGKDRVTMSLHDSDTNWQWDSSTRTDLPVATTTLVAAQTDYTLDVSMEKIEAVEVLDATGAYYPLLPLDVEDLRRQGITPSEFMDTNGLPQYYDKVGSSLKIYPQADSTSVTLALGLQIRFQRGTDYFVSTDTTKKPGFATTYHRLVSIWASRDYAIANKMFDKVTILDGEASVYEARLEKAMSKRSKDERPRMTASRPRSK